MYKFKFDTTKMSWEKIALTTNPGSIYAKIKISDANYYNQLKPILLNLRNNNFSFVLVDHAGSKVWKFSDIYFEGWNYVDNLPDINTIEMSNLSFTVDLRNQISTFGNLDGYWLYLLYN